jgi:arabinose-5-phosphate isomerase
MLTKKKIPFISENSNMKQALKIISQKKLGTLIVKNSRGVTTGMITDGTVRRTNEKNKNLQKLSVRSVMTKNPISVNGEMLAEKALGIMNQKKITSLCVNNSKNKTIGILHIHNILDAKIQ